MKYFGLYSNHLFGKIAGSFYDQIIQKKLVDHVDFWHVYNVNCLRMFKYALVYSKLLYFLLGSFSRFNINKSRMTTSFKKSFDF